MTPPKRSAPGRQIAGAAKLRLAEPHHACGHPATVIQSESPESLHYARELCANCGRFIRWLPKPETVEHRTFNAFRLAKLGMCVALNAWEQNLSTMYRNSGRFRQSKVQSLIVSGRNTKGRQHERDAI